MIQIIVKSNVCGCERIMPEHKVLHFLKNLYKSYIKNVKENSYMEVEFINLKNQSHE